MPEPGPVAQLDQARRLGRARRFRSDAEALHGPPQQRDVADRFGGRGQEQPSGLPRQGCQLPEEALFEAVHQRGGTGGADGAERQLGRRQPSWQLQEGEGVAVALGQDAVPDPRVEGAGYRRVQEPSGVAAAQPVHQKLREPGQDGLLVGLADGEHHGHGLDPQTAGDELQRLHRRPVQPLGVVHDTEQGQFLGDLAEQGEDRQSHQEAVGRGARSQPECRPEGVALRAREPVQPLQVRAAELVQAGVGELHLGLDTGGTADPAAGRMVEEELEQRGLADSGLSAQNQGPATARLHGGDEAGQRLALASSPQQARP